MLFLAILVTMLYYRKWKVEREIEGLLWKINPDCLSGINGMASYPSKQSLGSGMSGDSRGVYAAYFHKAAMYKNNLVRINVLKFVKKKDIPRDVMKEMKLMRDLHNDNINTFVGACVESHSVTLITEFCPKESLQVRGGHLGISHYLLLRRTPYLLFLSRTYWEIRTSSWSLSSSPASSST